jgi:hypothetical protein
MGLDERIAPRRSRRATTLRFNHLLATLERELEDKIDFATWARAVTAAKKKIPEWGESS